MPLLPRLSAPTYSGPRSDHFDGERFHNLQPTPHGGLDVLKWMLDVRREKGEWPRWVPAEPGPRPPERVGRGQMRVTFVNHATVLLQADGLNLLTDPIWSERCSPLQSAGPRRVRPPGLRLEDLPPLDAILLSHNHYDHVDLPTLRTLLRGPGRPRVVCPLGNAALLEREGLGSAEDLDWWQEVSLSADVRVTCVPAQHFSGRGLTDREKTLWCGFVVQGPAGGAYFAGDTGFGPHFQHIRERLGPMRLALLPIGAYQPVWFMGPVHMQPKEAVEAHRVLEADTSVGIHWGTFRLTDEGMEQPLVDLEAALAACGAERPRFWVLGFGEGRDVPEASAGAERSASR